MAWNAGCRGVAMVSTVGRGHVSDTVLLITAGLLPVSPAEVNMGNPAGLMAAAA